jgi:tRNA pseudouridine38-40 synthase
VSAYAVVLAYDGTDFVGWQRQAAGASIQGLLEEALAALDERPVKATGAGRTDAGVHALQQVASFTLERSIAADVLVRALNARLPPVIRIRSAREVPATFNARFDARAKSYRYRIFNDLVMCPFERHYAWHVTGRLDVAAMGDAARRFEGRHDFAAFQAAGSSVATSERTIRSSRLVSEAPDLILYEVTGDGFLRHMVRTMVGTLVEIGFGRRNADSIDELIASRDRSQAGPTAPAHGLFLMAVEYDALAAEP